MTEVTTEANSKMWKWLYLLGGAIGILVSSLILNWRQIDTDFWWHMADGRYIATHHVLMNFSLWVYGILTTHHWTMAEWGSELWMYLAGPQNTLVIYFVMLLGIGAVLTYRVWGLGMRRLEIIMLTPLALIALAVATLEPRDQLQGTLLLALVALAIEVEARNRKFSWWIFVPLFLLAANLHPSFEVALGVWAVSLAFWWWQLKRGGQHGISRSRLRVSSKWFVFSVLATLVNPYTYKLWFYIVKTLSSGAGMIQEWDSPNFHWLDLWPLALLVVLMPLIWQKLSPLARIWIVVGLLGTLYSVRNLELTTVLILPAVMVAIGNSIKDGRWAAQLPKPPTRGVIWMFSLVTVALVGLSATHLYNSYQNPFLGVKQPVVVSQWLTKDGQQGQRLFVEYQYNGYFIYHNPQNKVWIFGDSALDGTSVLEYYSSIIDITPQWKTHLLQTGAQLVIFPTDNPLVTVMAEEPSSFSLVFQRDGWSVYQIRY